MAAFHSCCASASSNNATRSCFRLGDPLRRLNDGACSASQRKLSQRNASRVCTLYAANFGSKCVSDHSVGPSAGRLVRTSQSPTNPRSHTDTCAAAPVRVSQGGNRFCGEKNKGKTAKKFRSPLLYTARARSAPVLRLVRTGFTNILLRQ